jgi:hypothetical protein
MQWNALRASRRQPADRDGEQTTLQQRPACSISALMQRIVTALHLPQNKL